MFVVTRDVRLHEKEDPSRLERDLVFQFHAHASNSDGHRRRRSAPFASLSQATIRSSQGQKLEVSGIMEPKTAVVYPDEYCYRPAPSCPKLTGLGVRSKTILGLKTINVYAIGLYIDHNGVKKTFHAYANQDPAKVVEQQALYDDVLAADSIEKTLRLVIHYGGLKRTTFLNALDERMAPELTKAGETEQLAAFRKQFDQVDLKKGTTFTFCARNGSLHSSVDGKEVGHLSSPALIRSLFNIYIGDNPVSKPAKEDFGQGLVKVLQ